MKSITKSQESVIDQFNAEEVIDALYDLIEEDDCANLSRYICKNEKISPEEVAFMAENGFSLSYEMSLKYAKIFFPKEMWNDVINNLITKNVA